MTDKMIECPVCEGDGCEDCQSTGSIPLPETALAYLSLQADAMMDALERGGYEGSSAHDMVQQFVHIARTAEKLYGEPARAALRAQTRKQDSGQSPIPD